MKIYDKAQWHLDAGEKKECVLARFDAVFAFLNEEHLLTADGEEIFDMGIDESISLHERLVTEEGNRILERCYDEIINKDADEIKTILNRLA